VTAHAGVASGSDLPQQLFRLGGPGTVRGYDYGTRRERSFWSAQLDWPLRRGVLQPVLMADVGQAAEPADLFHSGALASGGLGLRVAGGVLRLDLTRRFTGADHRIRFDLSVGAWY
jgi:hemolysin activation/secretion protein